MFNITKASSIFPKKRLKSLDEVSFCDNYNTAIPQINVYE